MAGPLVRWDSWVKDFLGCPEEKSKTKTGLCQETVLNTFATTRLGALGLESHKALFARELDNRAWRL